MPVTMKQKQHIVPYYEVCPIELRKFGIPRKEHLMVAEEVLWRRNYVGVLLVFLHLAIGFERALFPGLPIGHLTVFLLSVELKEAAT